MHLAKKKIRLGIDIHLQTTIQVIEGNTIHVTP